MWGDCAGRAPRWFKINPYNFSGRRLYFIAGESMLVTNACPQLQTHALHAMREKVQKLLNS